MCDEPFAERNFATRTLSDLGVIAKRVDTLALQKEFGLVFILFTFPEESKKGSQQYLVIDDRSNQAEQIFNLLKERWKK